MPSAVFVDSLFVQVFDFLFKVFRRKIIKNQTLILDERFWNNLRKLFEIDFSVAIEVETSENADDFFLSGDMVTLPHEALKIRLVTVSIIPIVNGLECLLGSKVI